jgi:hypothetical protein
MCIHDQTAAAIAAQRPGYAQMARDDPGDLVSWHGQDFSETRLSGWDRRDARCGLIDAWARGEARVTPGTFSETQILHRAEQWQHGRGRHIPRGQSDPALARQIRKLARPVPLHPPVPDTPRPDRSAWVLWVSGVGWSRLGK